MVRDNEENVLGAFELDEGGADHEVAAEVERLSKLDVQLPLQLRFAPLRRQRGQIDDGENGLRAFEHDLDGLFAFPREDRAQRLVSRNDVRHRLLELFPLELAADSNCEGAVVRRCLGGELVDDEERLLGERRRVRLHGRVQFVRLGFLVHAAPCCGHMLREERERRVLEERPHRELHREALADLRHDASREQRVAAEMEEVVVDADALDAENVTPDSGDDRLRRRARSDERAAGLLLP